MECTNDTGAVYFIVQALNTRGVWVDCHVFDEQTDAFLQLLDKRTLRYPCSRHRVVERTQKTLQEFDCFEPTIDSEM